MIDHFPVVLPGHAIDFHGLGLIDQVEQGGEGVAQAHAAATAVADIIDPLQLVEQVRLVIESRILPVQRVAGGSLQAAFATFFGRCGHGIPCSIDYRQYTYRNL